SLDILGNVIPNISGEEEKIERETQKILGALVNGEAKASPYGSGEAKASPYVEPHAAIVSAQTTRVPVIDGHTESVSVALDAKPSIQEVIAAFRTVRGRPQELGLPSAPPAPIIYYEAPDRPQPRLDAERDGGMVVSVGRARPCPVLGTKFIALGHNTIRGAAGAAVLNAELMRADGLLQGD
ncbi:MAG TPA: Asd/ArgC dimerization domain-containing protein, partial [Vicinamibacterales bacterium]